MPRGTKFPQEMRERAVRMVAEIGEPGRSRLADVAGGARRSRLAKAALGTPGEVGSGACDPTGPSCSDGRVATLRTPQGSYTRASVPSASSPRRV